MIAPSPLYVLALILASFFPSEDRISPRYFQLSSIATTKLTVAGYMTLVTPPHRSVTLDSHPLDSDTLDFDTLVSVTLDSDTKTLRILYGQKSSADRLKNCGYY